MRTFMYTLHCTRRVLAADSWSQSKRAAVVAIGRSVCRGGCFLLRPSRVIGRGGDTRYPATMKKLRLMVKGAERTEMPPALFEQMAKLDSMFKMVRLLVERIRRAAQPNKSYRTSDRLVASEGNVNERVQMIAAFKEAVSTFSENPSASAYMKAMADVQEEINRFHDRFLRQVQIYCVNELRKFTDQTYPEIKQVYDDLEQKRTGYDYARDRLRYCSADEVEARGAEAAEQQKLFEEQAAMLHAKLALIPGYQMSLAKAIDNYAKAEREYSRQTNLLYRRIISPELTKPNVGSRTELPEATICEIPDATKVMPTIRSATTTVSKTVTATTNTTKSSPRAPAAIKKK